MLQPFHSGWLIDTFSLPTIFQLFTICISKSKWYTLLIHYFYSLILWSLMTVGRCWAAPAHSRWQVNSFWPHVFLDSTLICDFCSWVLSGPWMVGKINWQFVFNSIKLQLLHSICVYLVQYKGTTWRIYESSVWAIQMPSIYTHKWISTFWKNFCTSHKSFGTSSHKVFKCS